ncbi:hypothetical protein MTR67_040045 [Solanum verrucosum]|uniref:Integrase catalytic domain-containing protein n=1 Tax=Solanum verrucosum TaxID=315347 RepID=A0AAF0UHX2_SOLVR|nr:hypothetical protein MTR67_040045 [Solanum verrucosum]
MDFIMGLTHTRRQHESIWVIVDKVNKSAHLLVVQATDSMEDYTRLYINEIVRLHEVPLSIISDRDGQAERTIQTLDDMLRACMIDFKGEADLIGLDSVHEALEKVQFISDRLKITRSHQNSYVGVRRRDLEFEIDELGFVEGVTYEGGDEIWKERKAQS